MEKYEITKNQKEYKDTTLYQIKALKDFGSVKKGDLGGWVEGWFNLSQEGNCWIDDKTFVFGNSEVSENAMIYNSTIKNVSCISGNAKVYNSIIDFSNTFGKSEVRKSFIFHSSIFDDAKVNTSIVKKSMIGNNTILINKNIFNECIR